MKSRKNSKSVLGTCRLALLIAAVSASGAAFAQKAAPKAVEVQSRLVLAVNEGGAANADATETLFRYQEFADIVEKSLRTQIVIVAVRDRNKLLAALKKHEYPLLLARPNDVPAQAIGLRELSRHARRRCHGWRGAQRHLSSGAVSRSVRHGRRAMAAARAAGVTRRSATSGHSE